MEWRGGTVWWVGNNLKEGHMGGDKCCMCRDGWVGVNADVE